MSVPKPTDVGLLNYDDLTLRASDGVALHAYLINQGTTEETRRAPTLLLLHVGAPGRPRARRAPICSSLTPGVCFRAWDSGNAHRPTPATWWGGRARTQSAGSHRSLAEA